MSEDLNVPEIATQTGVAIPTTHKPFTPEHRGGERMEAEVVPGLLPQGPEEFTSITVGNETVPVDPEILRNILRTTSEAYRLNEDNFDILCDEFAVALCGGYVRPIPALYGVTGPEYEFESDKITDITDATAIDALPAMQPIEMGVLTEDGTIDPVHTIVKLPGPGGLCVSKLGAGPVVITDIPGLAKYYESTHCVPISRMSDQNDRYGNILEYASST